MCRCGFSRGSRGFSSCGADGANYVKCGSERRSAKDSSRNGGNAGDGGPVDRGLSEVDSGRAWADRTNRKYDRIFYYGQRTAGEVGARQGGYVCVSPHSAARRDEARNEDRLSGFVVPVRFFGWRFDQRKSRPAELEHLACLPSRYKCNRRDVHAVHYDTGRMAVRNGARQRWRLGSEHDVQNSFAGTISRFACARGTVLPRDPTGS